MYKTLSKGVLIGAIFLILAGALVFANPSRDDDESKIVVADRASGTISVISTKTDSLIGTFALPSAPNTPEPMYVVYSPIEDRVFVGDRANDQVVVFEADDFSIEATVPAGAGVFHMWAGVRARQLWVNNDVDNTTTVINLRTLDILATVPTPSDLVNMGGKPHDVIVNPKGDYAYVSVVGVTGQNDYVVQFSTKTFMETNRAQVGKDPHLSLNWWNDSLYVPCQGNNEVQILNKGDLSFDKALSVPGAHGAGMTRHGLFFYTTNLPGGGTDALYTVFTFSNKLVGKPVDAPYPTPHNITLTGNSRKLYLTHSGATSDKVTVYKIKSFFNPIPVYSGEVTVGMNPFGLAFVPDQDD
jgi:DNA-binding beta-propeller fold protein YncE